MPATTGRRSPASTPRSTICSRRTSTGFPTASASGFTLKGTTPDAATLAAANAQIWATFQTRGLYTHWADADPLQEHIGRRYTEASLALGQLAEAAGRDAVAQDAYERVLRLYDVPAARDGLARLGGAADCPRATCRCGCVSVVFVALTPPAPSPHTRSSLRAEGGNCSYGHLPLAEAASDIRLPLSPREAGRGGRGG